MATSRSCLPIPAAHCFATGTTGHGQFPKANRSRARILLLTAQREFEEETGITPTGPFIPLRPIQQKGGKRVHAWAFQGDCDPTTLTCNTFTMEWPPHSGEQREFPECDRGEFFDLETARRKIKAGQDGLIDELASLVHK